MGLYDAFLIKENHIAIAGGITAAVARARKYASGRETTAYESFRPLPIQVEVRNETELREALGVKVESVLLDNFMPTEAGRLIAIAHRGSPTASSKFRGA